MVRTITNQSIFFYFPIAKIPQRGIKKPGIKYLALKKECRPYGLSGSPYSGEGDLCEYAAPGALVDKAIIFINKYLNPQINPSGIRSLGEQFMALARRLIWFRLYLEG